MNAHDFARRDNRWWTFDDKRTDRATLTIALPDDFDARDRAWTARYLRAVLEMTPEELAHHDSLPPDERRSLTTAYSATPLLAAILRPLRPTVETVFMHRIQQSA